MKKTTQKEIDELSAELEALQAEYNDARCTDTRRQELRPELQAMNEKVRYMQLWLDFGCKLGDNGKPLIGQGIGYQTTVDI